MDINSPTSLTLSVVKDAVIGRRLRFRLLGAKGFSTEELKRLRSAGEILEVVVNSAEFRQSVVSKKFSTTKLTGQQIYDKMMTGAETLSPEVDYEFDVNVEIYEKNNSTVGYTYETSIQTWINRKFFKNFSIGEIAANMLHEWLHKMGFDHASAKDYNSVPYWTGYLVRDMVKAYESGTRYTDLYPIAVATTSGPPVIIEPAILAKEKVCTRLWYTLWLKQVCWYEEV